jgi:hypothetical protein
MGSIARFAPVLEAFSFSIYLFGLRSHGFARV